MKIFDFNIHLPYSKNDDVNQVIFQDRNLGISDISKGLRFYKEHFIKINGANILLFNTSLLDNDISSLNHDLSNVFETFYITNLIDFRRLDIKDYLHRAKTSGVNAIMFNSYLQEIADEDFELVLHACHIAESLQLVICIDGSYGTSKMYSYNNMKLICYIADHISKTNIVIVHSGGYNIMNAMLLALDKTNVWLDTSFSLPYYANSSIEIDIAFAYRKMNYQRIIFGSDHPYIKVNDAIEAHLRFFEKYNIPQSSVEDILFNNACLLFNQVLIND